MTTHKDLFKGLFILAITLVYGLLMTLGVDLIRQLRPGYWNVVTIAGIVSLILFNLTLIFLFYTRAATKYKYSLLWMAMPSVLFYIVLEMYEINIPRLLDPLFLAGGVYLIFKITKIHTESRKAVLLLGLYFVIIAAIYPYLTALIGSNMAI